MATSTLPDNDSPIAATVSTETERFILWYDPSKVPTAEKIMAASRRYRDNYGEGATVCLCNSRDIGPLIEVALDGQVILVRAVAHVRPDNFLVGRE